jgi:hypothetical protein
MPPVVRDPPFGGAANGPRNHEGPPAGPLAPRARISNNTRSCWRADRMTDGPLFGVPGQAGFGGGLEARMICPGERRACRDDTPEEASAAVDRAGRSSGRSERAPNRARRGRSWDASRDVAQARAPGRGRKRQAPGSHELAGARGDPAAAQGALQDLVRATQLVAGRSRLRWVKSASVSFASVDARPGTCPERRPPRRRTLEVSERRGRA